MTTSEPGFSGHAPAPGTVREAPEETRHTKGSMVRRRRMDVTEVLLPCAGLRYEFVQG